MHRQENDLSLFTLPGAILEISLRVGVTPLNVPLLYAFQTSFWADTHKEASSPFKELYLVYFVQNYA